MSRTHYRLPDLDQYGYFYKYTQDPDEYANAWRDWGAKIEALFPGYKAASYDPDIEFQKWGLNGLGKNVIVDRFVLSVSACNTLLETVQIKES